METMFMQNFGGHANKECYGIFESGLLLVSTQAAVSKQK